MCEIKGIDQGRLLEEVSIELSFEGCNGKDL